MAIVEESIANRECVAMFLDYFALAVLVIVVLVIFYGVIVIHDIPYGRCCSNQGTIRQFSDLIGLVDQIQSRILAPQPARRA